MLYSIKTKVNDFINEHLNGAAVAIIGPLSREPFYYPFTQCKETDEGLLISSGYDEYLPSSTMHMLRGIISFDEESKAINIDGPDETYKIVEAEGKHRKTVISYLGTYTTEDVERMKKHIRQIESA